jgi:hypothetical protein
MHEPALREAQAEYDAAWHASIAQVLGELTDDVDLLTQRVVGLMDGLSVALLTGDATLTIEQAWEHVKALLPPDRHRGGVTVVVGQCPDGVGGDDEVDH